MERSDGVDARFGFISCARYTRESEEDRGDCLKEEEFLREIRRKFWLPFDFLMEPRTRIFETKFCLH